MGIDRSKQRARDTRPKSSLLPGTSLGLFEAGHVPRCTRGALPGGFDEALLQQASRITSVGP